MEVKADSQNAEGFSDFRQRETDYDSYRYGLETKKEVLKALVAGVHSQAE